MPTFADVLSAHGTPLPPALLGAPARAALLAVARTLPAEAVSAFYLEARLRAGADAVDLVVEVDVRRSAFMDEEAARSPAWRRIAECRAAVLDPSLPLRELASSFWLEYDVDPSAGAENVSAPGVFVGLKPIVPGAAGVERWEGAAGALLRPLLGRAPEAELLAGVRDVFLRLPSTARVLYLGVMLSRPAPAARLCVGGIPPGEIPGYLREAGWPGDARALAELGRALCHTGGEPCHPGAQMLHFDVGPEGMLPRVGFEYVLRRSPQLDGALHETAFLDNLVARGLCAAPKRAGLDAWPGLRLEALPNHAERRVILQRVNHVKLVVEDGRPEAKAYFLATDLPLSALASPPEG
jgi:hypothetical protein